MRQQLKVSIKKSSSFALDLFQDVLLIPLNTANKMFNPVRHEVVNLTVNIKLVRYAI